MTLAFEPSRAAIAPRPYQQEICAALVAATTPIVPGGRHLVHVATGGGKRLIVNDFLATRSLRDRIRTLVLAKDWSLVAQLAEDLVERHQGALAEISVLGNPPDPSLFAPARSGAEGRVVFTTLQTWMARRQTLSGIPFQVIVLDDHWAEHASLQRILYAAYSGSAVFVGATATPLVGTAYRVVGRSYGFQELVDLGVLAQPILTTIDTDVAWAPRRRGHGDFLGSSLAQLGLESRRNDCVVDAYLEGRAKYGFTIVFACNIAHAELLTEQLTARGVTAAVMHSELSAAENAQTLSRMRASDVEVVVNVAMLTHGIDIPDLQTVFLARPTTSGVLLAQMIGRAARRTPQKNSFHIVDFSDCVGDGADEIARPASFIGRANRATVARCPPIRAHGFVPAPFAVLGGGPGRKALDGLEINEQQTFGIEFEATRKHGVNPRFTDGARSLLDALRASVPTSRAPHTSARSSEKDNAVWNVEPDPSCGFEVTTRILRGEAGCLEVVEATRILEATFERLGLTVMRRCVGTHVHIGADLDRAQITNLLAISAWFEPAILSLVPPSRADVVFVRSVRPFLRRLRTLPEQADWRTAVAHSLKYLGVNVRHLVSGYGTVEVRFHSGTVDADKILQWISLWMRIIDAARRGACPGDPLRKRVRTRPLCTGERGDIRALCAFVGAGPKLTQRLLARRDDLVARTWARDPDFGPLARRVAATWRPRPDE